MIQESDLKHCITVLEKVLADRTLLATLPQPDRTALLIAAGKLSRPEKLELMKMAKSYRKARKRKEKQHDRTVTAATSIRSIRRESVYIAPPKKEGEPEKIGELIHSRHCYVCKVNFSKLHFFYDAMCPNCAAFNYEKRFQTCSLKGKTAVITGSRLKIGYQASLMMLRAGAKVIATTRFPRDSAARYCREPDYEEWKDRLHIFGLDLRHSPSVESFAAYISLKFSGLDILINNAAQTVRRPSAFFAHMRDLELKPFSELPGNYQSLLKNYEECREFGKEQLAFPVKDPNTLLQLPAQYDKFIADIEVFPQGRSDADLQQVDLRRINSWRLTLAQVPTAELIEVQLINAIAPFILCAKLKPLMLRSGSDAKHIVNVSAMEGKFSRHTKTDKHPHTNMAKASLNMMTLTSASDYAKEGIYMNAVDTGWVTDEDPAHLSQAKQVEHNFQPPLDIVDGAARVCDPFFSGYITGVHVWGKFLKDYHPTTW